MTNMQSRLGDLPVESLIGTILALAIVGLCIAVGVHKYWNWRFKKPGSTAVNFTKRKPTLFDVREFLTKNDKVKAVKVYRQIFKVDQKEAQKAVDELQKNMHQQG